jgi:hypothetical protein
MMKKNIMVVFCIALGIAFGGLVLSWKLSHEDVKEMKAIVGSDGCDEHV